VQERLGDYVIHELLGAGGMGQVFLAEHCRMQRTVALKTLPVHRLGDQKASDRFFSEVRAASRVMHPNIVTAFDAGEQDGVPYLAMEYVDGLTLTEIISRSGPMPVGEAAAVIRQAALGLLHAHRAGLIHRDVKPGNLMRAVDGTIKVLDLGLAQISSMAVDAIRTRKGVDSAESEPPSGQKLRTSRSDVGEGLTEARSNASEEQKSLGDGNKSSDTTRGKKKRGKLIGTLSFMSPEQLEDPESVDSRSDIYSLGATLFFLLTSRPPYQGEFLDQVYGHRHGEIPDLMQVRDDVDMHFANVFRRMMAKSPGERYNSLDEVIDDLSSYAPTSSGPHWLTEMARSNMVPDLTTLSGGSTYGGESTVIRRTEVVGLDIGMFDITAASVGLGGELRHLTPGEDGQPLFRMLMADHQGKLFFGEKASRFRVEHPENVVHCVPMYIGQRVVERDISGRRCPPEALLGSMIRRAMQLAWRRKQPPEAVAVTVPAVYDQLHRRSLFQAATIAGLRSIRLVDRSLAAAQVLLFGDVNGDGLSIEMRDPNSELPVDSSSSAALSAPEASNILYLELSGQVFESAVIRKELGRLQQLGAGGHWHHGKLAWLGRLVDLTAELFMESIELDPRKSLRRAARLQIACERAMQTLVMLPSVKITIEAAGHQVSVVVSRTDWLKRCDDLIEMACQHTQVALQRSGVEPSAIGQVLMAGTLLRIPEIRDRILSGFPERIEKRAIDGNEIACGAAACLAGELPGRGEIAMPPRNVASQQIGVLVEDHRGRNRILPIVPRGTILPARTNRRINAGKQSSSLTLSLVESSGLMGEEWQSLGQYSFDVLPDDHPGRMISDVARRGRMIGFEVDVNGLLTVRAQTPNTPGSQRMPSLPAPSISESELSGWIEWVSEQNVG
ncbi:MAG: Hsp70 family protein, partial [Planctomycetota bacterium]